MQSRSTDIYYNNIKNLSFDYELKGISFYSKTSWLCINWWPRIMTALECRPFFFFFSSSRFGVTLEAVFLLFVLINRRQRRAVCSPGSSLQPQNSSGWRFCGAAVALPLASLLTVLPINRHGNPGWRLFLDPRNFSKTTACVAPSPLLLQLLLFLTSYATISKMYYCWVFCISLFNWIFWCVLVPSVGIKEFFCCCRGCCLGLAQIRYVELLEKPCRVAVGRAVV